MKPLMLYQDALKEAEKRPVESGQAQYLLPVQAYRISDAIEDAEMYPNSDVVRVSAHTHGAGVKP